MSKGREGICKRACCWTPLGVCAKGGSCSCHTLVGGEHARQERKKQAEMRRQDALIAELSRNQEVAERAGITWIRH